MGSNLCLGFFLNEKRGYFGCEVLTVTTQSSHWALLKYKAVVGFISEVFLP